MPPGERGGKGWLFGRAEGAFTLGLCDKELKLEGPGGRDGGGSVRTGRHTTATASSQLRQHPPSFYLLFIIFIFLGRGGEMVDGLVGRLCVVTYHLLPLDKGKWELCAGFCFQFCQRVRPWSNQN